MITYTGGEIVYFELDVTGQLNEFTERRALPGEVSMGVLDAPV